MTRRLPSIVALSAVLLLCQSLPAVERGEDDPRHWLRRMVTAARTVNFTGKLVYAQDAHLDTLRITRLHAGNEQRERIFSLSGQVQEILRDGHQVTRIFPADQVVMVDQSEEGRRHLTDLSQEQIRQLESWYTLSLPGEDRVADRAVVRVDILPRDEYRYGYRLWLDRETGLLLRFQLQNLGGDVLEQFMYVGISFDNIEPQTITPSLDYEGFRHLSIEAAPAPDVNGDWRVTNLPDGFTQLSRNWWKMPGISEPVRHLLFGDGLSSVSVYIAPDSGKPFHGQSGLGGMHMAGRVIEDHQVTVVGDVPGETVMRIMNGLEYQP